MAEMLVHLKFVYNVPMLPALHKMFQRDFMKMRARAVELLNPHYDEWNDTYEHSSWFDEERFESKKYIAYITQEQNVILNKVNAEFPKASINLVSDPEECGDIMAECRLFPGIKMHMLLIPIEEGKE